MLSSAYTTTRCDCFDIGLYVLRRPWKDRTHTEQNFFQTAGEIPSAKFDAFVIKFAEDPANRFTRTFDDISIAPLSLLDKQLHYIE